jgi:hypothetical protein
VTDEASPVCVPDMHALTTMLIAAVTPNAPTIVAILRIAPSSDLVPEGCAAAVSGPFQGGYMQAGS